MEVKVTVVVNGVRINSTSRKHKLQFPNFDVNIGESLHLFLFTMPESIKLLVTVGGEHVGLVPIEVPGELTIQSQRHKTLSSTYSITREVAFSKKEYLDDRKLPIPRKTRDAKARPKSAMPKDPQKLDEAKPEEEEAPPVQVDQFNEYAPKKKHIDTHGFLYIKAEWKDKDTYMPPIPSQRFLIKAYQKEKKQMSFPQRDKYLQQKLFIDVNDPRHDYLLMDMKEKNQHLRALLEADVKNPLHDVQPFRHQLMH